MKWDSPYSSVTVRGDLTGSTSIAGGSSFFYDQAGNVTHSSIGGVTTTVTPDSTNNYAVPSELSAGSLTETLNLEITALPPRAGER